VKAGGEGGLPRIRVAAIIAEKRGLLMVQHEKGGRRYWMLPGGGVDAGEPLAAALVRELREETGIEIRVRDLVMVNDSIAPDGSRHIVNLYFMAERLRGEPVRGGDARIIEVAFIPLERLPAVTMFPDFGRELCAMLEHGFPGGAYYPGNLWKS
jgi:8-oxo-dGTP diphosphatase